MVPKSTCTSRISPASRVRAPPAQSALATVVVAIGSRDASKGLRLLERYGLEGSARAYGSYEEVLADPEVDAVYVPLPTTLHVRWVRLAAEAGKAVLLEKPIALTAAATDEVVGACRGAGVQLMDGARP